MSEEAVKVDWDNIGRTRREIPSQQLEGLWSEWAQGKGFQISYSLGDWGTPEVYCPAFTVNSKSSRGICYVDGQSIEDTVEDLLSKHKDSKKPQKRDSLHSFILNDYVLRSFLRSGWLVHSNIQTVLDRMTQVDDVIIGADTNIFLGCVFSAVLLPMLENYEEPNWILIVIPKVVTAEIERQADDKYQGDHAWAGYPTKRARIAQRALQEILCLDTSRESKYRGMSIMSVGELPPNYSSISGDSVLKDSTIRKQFRDFLRAITFHKGAFLISEDRVNVMMARAEGIESLYLQKPSWKDLLKEPIRQDRQCGMTLWKLIYELCVSFGAVRILHGSQILELNVFWPGKHVKDWEVAKLQVQRVDS